MPWSVKLFVTLSILIVLYFLVALYVTLAAAVDIKQNQLLTIPIMGPLIVLGIAGCIAAIASQLITQLINIVKGSFRADRSLSVSFLPFGLLIPLGWALFTNFLMLLIQSDYLIFKIMFATLSPCCLAYAVTSFCLLSSNSSKEFFQADLS